MSPTPPFILPESPEFARALSRLSFVEREALLLKTRDGLTYAEIGAVLGLTPEAAQARFAAALVSLRTRLERNRRFPWLFR